MTPVHSNVCSSRLVILGTENWKGCTVRFKPTVAVIYLLGQYFKEQKTEKVVRFKSALIPHPIPSIRIRVQTSQESLIFPNSSYVATASSRIPRKQHEHA